MKNKQKKKKPKSKKTQNKNKKGFSFLEVIIGCLLFTVGTINIYTIYTAGEKAIYYANKRVKALLITDNIAEEIQNQKFGEIKTKTIKHPYGQKEFTTQIKVTPKTIPLTAKTIYKDILIETTYKIENEPYKTTQYIRLYNENKK